MKQWTEKNGGKFVREISRLVTHLVCSKEDFKTKSPFVQQAMRIPTIKIVSFDWFEDSLMLGKRIPEDLYLMGPRARAEAQARTSKRKTRRQNIKKGMKLFERSCQEFTEVMGCDGYQLYRDHTSFLYDITLVRANLLENKNRAYHLKLYESHAVPKSYACFVRYSEPGYTFAEPLAPVGSTFEAAMHVFKMFFGLKTRKRWEDRLLPGKADPDAFMYFPPGSGQSVGVRENDNRFDAEAEREAEALKSLLCQIEMRKLGMTQGEYGY